MKGRGAGRNAEYKVLYEKGEKQIMKYFNTTGICIPKKHYMVDIAFRLEVIKCMVDRGDYFTINRARQYGKTTTLGALSAFLEPNYSVLSLDFQKISTAGFRTEEAFVKSFSRIVLQKRERANIPIPIIQKFQNFVEREKNEALLDELFAAFNDWCTISHKPVVMFIDEVDSAADNQVFLDFLAQLRAGYLDREADAGLKTFQSVILAGVTDIKHLKGKLRDGEQHKVNSPWNIAVDFDLDMSLPEEGIKGMLDQYEADHHTGMDTAMVAGRIREYTGGYPFLVSRICQIVDEKLVPEVFSALTDAWTGYGIDEAVKRILSEDNTLFDSLMGKLYNYPELRQQLRDILLKGETIANLPDDEAQQQLRMYGFIRNDHNRVAIANRIFEMRLYHYFIGETNKNDGFKKQASASRSIFVEDGWLNVPKIMEHFIKANNEIHGGQTEKFLEEEGRERFLTYLMPIINGTGTYSIEEQTRDHRRMDVVIHYLGKRYVIEMKIWHGERHNAEGEKQISEYLEYFGLDTGYLLSFNFNKKKEQGVKRVQVGEKVVFEGIV